MIVMGDDVTPHRYAANKVRDVAPAFLRAGYTFAPFIMEFFGGFHETALQEIREVAEEIARVRGLPASQVAAFWKKALSFTLHAYCCRSLSPVCYGNFWPQTSCCSCL